LPAAGRLDGFSRASCSRANKAGLSNRCIPGVGVSFPSYRALERSRADVWTFAWVGWLHAAVGGQIASATHWIPGIFGVFREFGAETGSLPTAHATIRVEASAGIVGGVSELLKPEQRQRAELFCRPLAD